MRDHRNFVGELAETARAHHDIETKRVLNRHANEINDVIEKFNRARSTDTLRLLNSLWAKAYNDLKSVTLPSPTAPPAGTPEVEEGFKLDEEALVETRAVAA